VTSETVTALLADLRRDEGTVRNSRGRHLAYVDTVGKLTVGFGRNLTDRGLSDAEAELLLRNDVADHWVELVKALPWVVRLDPVRQRVLANMAFNLGVPKLLKFHRTLDLVKRGAFEAAAVAMLQSRWAEQVGARADRLAVMMRDGVSAG
jgi:lysozyme